MERRQNTGERCKIVQDYLKTIDDDTERLVCYLYLNNYEDYEVRKQLKIKQKRLEEIKASIRLKLLQAGIRTRGNCNETENLKKM